MFIKGYLDDEDGHMYLVLSIGLGTCLLIMPAMIIYCFSFIFG